ncbi:MAG TPA: copper chaperone PCu(A)C [Gallionellaceae bacterium]|nr:copper chaperone PCu(A)C [Gallionellaceae bacterium]
MLRNWILAVLLLVCSPAWAGGNDVIVDRVKIGESVPGQTSATLELNISTIKPATLLSVSSPAAKEVEIHSMMLYKGKMVVRVVDQLAMPAHRTMVFGSHQLFLMMVGLKQQMNVGDKVPVTLQVAYDDGRKQSIDVTAEVTKMALSYKHLGPNEVHDHR